MFTPALDTKIIAERMTHKAHAIIKQVVRAGDIVVDATVGNGYDTVFLRDIVGEAGEVFGFDIQAAALHVTELKFNQYPDACINVTLFQACHSKMIDHLPHGCTEMVAGVMFNLGYLPGAAHEVCTNSSTTAKAIEQSLRLLKVGGVLTVVVYTGHEGGPQELAAVEALAVQSETNDVAWCKYVSDTAPNTAPVLFKAERIKPIHRML